MLVIFCTWPAFSTIPLCVSVNYQMLSLLAWTHFTVVTHRNGHFNNDNRNWNKKKAVCNSQPIGGLTQQSRTMNHFCCVRFGITCSLSASSMKPSQILSKYMYCRLTRHIIKQIQSWNNFLLFISTVILVDCIKFSLKMKPLSSLHHTNVKI